MAALAKPLFSKVAALAQKSKNGKASMKLKVSAKAKPKHGPATKERA